MCNNLKELIKLHFEISVDFNFQDRNLISVGFRNQIQHLQTAVKVAHYVGKNPKYRKYHETLPDFKKVISEEYLNMAKNNAYLMTDKAYKCASNNESMAFFQKVAGDHFRYAFEAATYQLKDIEDGIKFKKKMVKHKMEAEKIKNPSKPIDENKYEKMLRVDPKVEVEMEELKKELEYLQSKALKCYSFALHKAEKGLLSANPTRLSCSLNFAVFQMECLKDKDAAMKTCQKAVEVGLKKLESIDDPDDFADAKRLIDMLKENLTIWEDVYPDKESEDEEEAPKKEKNDDEDDANND